jgi:hypothetical protein
MYWCLRLSSHTPTFTTLPPYRNVIYTRDQKPLDTQEAQVSLAQIPFVRLRHELPSELLAGKLTFSQTVEKAQGALAPAQIVYNKADKTIHAGNTLIKLSPILMAFYWLFLDDRIKEGGGIHYNQSETITQDFLDHYARLVGGHSGDYVNSEKVLKRNGIGVFQASCRKNHVILLIFSGLRIWVQFNRINRRPISCFF